MIGRLLDGAPSAVRPGELTHLRSRGVAIWLVSLSMLITGAALVLLAPGVARDDLASVPAAIPLGLASVAASGFLIARRRRDWAGSAEGSVVDPQSARDLAGFVAHELNNLLTILSFDGEIIGHHAAGDAELRAMSVSIDDACRHGADLTQLLLAFAGRQILSRRVVDLPRELSRLTASLVSVLPKGQSLTFDCTTAELRMLIDPKALETCLRQLVTYAGSVSGAMDRITLGLSAGAGAAPAASAMVEIAVSSGIAAIDETARRLATPRERSRMSPELVLLAADGFARQCGGWLTVRRSDGSAQDGQPMHLLLYLPMTQEIAEPAVGPGPRSADARRARVLVVDDNEPLRVGLVNRLRAQGHDVVGVGDVGQARPLLEAGFDALVTDVVLGGAEDGVALATAARARDATMALVFISGVMSSRQPRLLAGDDLVSFVRKPIDIVELAAVLEGLLAVRAMRRGG